jgi:hypothetical protein
LRLATEVWRAVRRALIVKWATPAEFAASSAKRSLRSDPREPRATQAPAASRSCRAIAALRDMTSHPDARQRRADVATASHAPPSPA